MQRTAKQTFVMAGLITLIFAPVAKAETCASLAGSLGYDYAGEMQFGSSLANVTPFIVSLNIGENEWFAATAVAETGAVRVDLADYEDRLFPESKLFPRGDNVFLNYRDIPAGEFCVKVTSPSGTSSEAHLRVDTMTDDMRALYKSQGMSIAPPADLVFTHLISNLETEFEQRVQLTGQALWVKLILDKPARILARTDTPEDVFADPIIALFKETGEIVVVEDNLPDQTLDPTMDVEVPAGMYWFGVRQVPSRENSEITLTIEKE
jgi:hypothetical protein